jgi:hypothetical protein
MIEKLSGSTKSDCYNNKFKGLCKVLSRKINFRMTFIKLLGEKISVKTIKQEYAAMKASP